MKAVGESLLLVNVKVTMMAALPSSSVVWLVLSIVIPKSTAAVVAPLPALRL